MKALLSLFVFAVSVPAFAGKIESDFATCKPITPSQVMIPGDSSDVKGTTLRANDVKLSMILENSSLRLKLVATGTDVNGKALTREIEGELAESIGGTYQAYRYDARNVADELRFVKMTTETLESNPKDGTPKKVLLSVLVKSVRDVSGKKADYLYLTNHFCDVIAAP